MILAQYHIISCTISMVWLCLVKLEYCPGYFRIISDIWNHNKYDLESYQIWLTSIMIHNIVFPTTQNIWNQFNVPRPHHLIVVFMCSVGFFGPFRKLVSLVQIMILLGFELCFLPMWINLAQIWLAHFAHTPNIMVHMLHFLLGVILEISQELESSHIERKVGECSFSHKP